MSRSDSRVPCMVPGCGRSIGPRPYVKQFGHPPGSWVCPTHWRLVPRRLKRVKARHERERRKYGFHPREAAYARLWAAIWRSMTVEG